MNQKKMNLVVAAALAWTLMSCGLPYLEEPLFPTLSALTVSATETPAIILPSPSFTAVLENPTATNPPTAIPSPTAVKVDLTHASLRLEELPKGFQVLDQESQAQAGLSPDAIAQSFKGIFQQAQPIHSFAYVTTDLKNFEIVVGLVFYPIITAEQASFDQMLTDPNGAIKNFAMSFGGEVKSLANLATLGDSRAGWGFTSSSGQPPLNGEMVIIRRETVVTLLLTMFPSDQKPLAAVGNLAQTLDANVKKGLGK